MLFVKSENLKIGMIIAKDLDLKNDSFIPSLLSKGEVLSRSYINKIIIYGISGVFVEGKGFNNITIKPYLDKTIEEKSLLEIESVFTNFKNNEGRIDASMVNQISKIVSSLTSDILPKKDLANNIKELKNYDDYTYYHCLNVAVLSISTGVALNLSEKMLRDLGMCGILHDIGKMLIPLKIINKPGKLTHEEFANIKMHPVYACNQLKNIVSDEILTGIEEHHEKMDGSGYPYGKKNESISLYGKILAVCDVYDALTSDRPYRKTCFPGEVIEYMMGCVDKHFDLEILSKFLKSIAAYPVGTYVKLSNKVLGVVIKNFSENILRPVVRVINQDNTLGMDIDLFNDKTFMNVTIIGMGYDINSINVLSSKNVFMI
jgi:HD-GYP domain-containing protein (c-di-GMP phosphodiesterase class II)